MASRLPLPRPTNPVARFVKNGWRRPCGRWYSPLEGRRSRFAPVIAPQGQRCSQAVRAWFVEQVGGSFSFDGEMRAFFAGTDGTQTL